MIIKAGTVITLERGSYSDQVYDGPFFVQKDIDQEAVVKAFKEQWTPRLIKSQWSEYNHVRNKPYPEDFIAWLTTQGFIEDAKFAHRWYLGDYTFDPSIDEGHNETE